MFDKLGIELHVPVFLLRWHVTVLTGYSGGGRDLLQLPITSNVVSLNPTLGEEYSIQHYVIKYVNDLRSVSDFPRVLSLSGFLHQ
jgi:hypothetical protein